MLIDYALNYFPSTLLTLSTILAIYNIDNKATYYNRYYPLILIMGFFTGIFHEGFSLPLLAGLTIIAITHQFRMSRQWWGVYAAILIGTAICAGSPAIWARFYTTMEDSSGFHIWPYVRAFVKNTPLFFIFIIVSLIALFNPKSREILKSTISDKLDQYTILTAIFGAIMVIILKAPVRATTEINILFIIIFLRIIKSLKFHIPAKISSIVTSVTLFIIYLFYIGVLCWQYKIYIENNKIISQLNHTAKNESIYKDTIRQSPWWTLSHPVTNIWYTNMQASFINLIYNRQEDIPPVLPQILNNYDFNNPIPIPGTIDYFQAGDILLLKTKATNQENMLPRNWRFTLSNGKEIGSYVTFIPFTINHEKWIAGFPSKSCVKGPFIKITPSY